MKSTLLLLLGLTLTACISTSEVLFTSEPPGAMVLVDGSPRGLTPMRLKLLNKQDHTVLFDFLNEGSLPALLESRRRFNWVTLGPQTFLSPSHLHADLESRLVGEPTDN